VTSLDAVARRTLAALADVVVPAEDGLPSASEAGVEGDRLDASLRARPDLRAALAEVLARAAGRDPHAMVAQLSTDDPAGFAVLVDAVVGAYFLAPAVRAAYGYPGQRQVPFDPGDASEYLDLLPVVIERGPIHRPVS
jgi:hypothetical protein